MNASTATLSSSPLVSPESALGMLLAAGRTASLLGRIEDEIFGTEFGSELVRSSVVVDRSGESFTAIAARSFSMGRGVGQISVGRGDRVEFDGELNLVSASTPSALS